ncbi:hypothetical protein GYMLUDRAFT_38988 [Collybiopsis luxurians FD-317 M1]|nr:hypothetical protein GYMLUDRAFT_38988 [Collybiopsis luxurians FD-317 M1]
MMLSAPAASTRQQIFTAVQSNTKHQYALEKYSQRLAAELQEIDKLLAAADINVDSDEELGDVEIKGATRPAGPIPDHEFLNPVSPFYNDASKRSRYIEFTTTHPMKSKELDVLTEAVTAEFRRLRVMESQDSQRIDSSEPIDLTADVEKLNWKIIAEKVTDVSSFTRTDLECKIKWLGYHRPGITHDEWTSTELEQLKKIVEDKEQENEHKLDWVEVAKELGTNRTPIDCMRHGLQRSRHSWTPANDQKLVEGVQVYGLENWALVAVHVSPYVTPNQCQMRYIRSLDPTLNKSPWTTAEDERLNQVVSAIGTSDWVEVARHMPGRTNEICRERYLEVGKRKVKGKGKGKGKGKDKEKAKETEEEWTKDQDAELIRLVGEMGNKWQKISEAMGGVYNNNQCRSRYNKLRKSMGLQGGESASTSSTHVTHAQQLNVDHTTSVAGPSSERPSTSSYPPGAILMLAPPSWTPTSSAGPSSALETSSVPDQPSIKSKPRPRPKPKPKTSGIADVSPANQEFGNDSLNASTSVHASLIPSAHKATGKVKRASRHSQILAEAIDLDLGTLQLPVDRPLVNSNRSSENGNTAGGNRSESTGVASIIPLPINSSQSVTSTNVEPRRSTRRSKGLAATIEVDLDSLNPTDVAADSGDVLLAAESSSGTAARVATVGTSKTPGKRMREEAADPAFFGPFEARAETSDTAAKGDLTEHGSRNDAATPSHGPARKKGRSRNSTANGTSSPSASSNSVPSTPASERRRSSRLVTKPTS